MITPPNSGTNFSDNPPIISTTTNALKRRRGPSTSTTQRKAKKTSTTSIIFKDTITALQQPPSSFINNQYNSLENPHNFLEQNGMLLEGINPAIFNCDNVNNTPDGTTFPLFLTPARNIAYFGLPVKDVTQILGTHRFRKTQIVNETAVESIIEKIQTQMEISPNERELTGHRYNVIVEGPTYAGKHSAVCLAAAKMFTKYSKYFQNTSMFMIDGRELNLAQKGALDDFELFLYNLGRGTKDILYLRRFDEMTACLNDMQMHKLVSMLHKRLQEAPNFQFIATSTKQKKQTPHPFFQTACQYISFDEMEDGDVKKIIKNIYSLTLSDTTIDKILKHTKTLTTTKADPVKTIDFIELCMSKYNLKYAQQVIADISFDDYILESIARKPNLPSNDQLTEAPSIELYKNKLKNVIIGQDHLLDTIAKDIFTIKMDLQNKKKPPMVYVFAGPTGVGKTELAKQIGNILYDTPNQFNTLDMAEYHSKGSKAKLIGAEPGFTGCQDGGKLTNILQEGSKRVILLDELEKAEPSVLNLFLSIFDEGRVSTGLGKQMDCKDTCFIMTSNLGAKEYNQKNSKQKPNLEKIQAIVERQISEKFGPEWLNRVQVKTFLPLNDDSAEKLVLHHLQFLYDEMHESRKLQLQWSPKLIEHLKKTGFNPESGARSLIRHIDGIRPAIGTALQNVANDYQGPLYCTVNQNEEIVVTDNYDTFCTLNEYISPTPTIKPTVQLYKAKLQKAVVGQDHLLNEIASDVFTVKKGMATKKKPPIVYVFAGPSGVGKTEMAKQIGNALYEDQPNHFHRLDMAEFHSEAAKARLIGAAQGYINSDEGGQLTNILESGSNHIILLDEIEKADPKVMNLFLSIFDEGLVSSAKGKLYDCKETCFVMTTNAGAEDIYQEFAKQVPDIAKVKTIVEKQLANKFGTEWVNRVKVKVFKPLNENSAEAVVRHHLSLLQKEIAEDRKIKLHWSPDLIENLKTTGFKIESGARSFIQRIDDIRPAIAIALDELEENYEGSLYCTVDLNGEFVVTADAEMIDSLL